MWWMEVEMMQSIPSGRWSCTHCRCTSGVGESGWCSPCPKPTSWPKKLHVAVSDWQRHSMRRVWFTTSRHFRKCRRKGRQSHGLFPILEPGWLEILCCPVSTNLSDRLPTPQAQYEEFAHLFAFLSLNTTAPNSRAPLLPSGHGTNGVDLV